MYNAFFSIVIYLKQNKLYSSNGFKIISLKCSQLPNEVLSLPLKFSINFLLVAIAIKMEKLQNKACY